MKRGPIIRASWIICAALIAAPGCDDRHCGPPPKPDSGVVDGALDRIAVVLPEAGADTGAADRMDTGAADGRDASSTDGSDSSVMVGVTFNSCPNIVASTASPPMAPVGAMITVTVAANDPDPKDKLTYAWSAPSGTFATPTAAGTMYTCATVGPQTLTVKVSDGQCVQTVMLPITCTAPDAGAAD